MQAHIDVTASGVGVRADHVSGIDQLLSVGLLQAWQADMQIDVQTETAWNLANAYMGGNRGVCRNAAFALTGHELQCTDEAGRITGSEQLLRVSGCAASTTEFFRGRQLDVENLVVGNSTTITAAVKPTLVSPITLIG